MQLRAALDEERVALLAQTEQLHLMIDDEVDFRTRSVTPPPSSIEMQALKQALQASTATPPTPRTPKHHNITDHRHERHTNDIALTATTQAWM